MIDAQLFLDRLEIFLASEADLLLIIQCDVEWFNATNAPLTMEFEYRLARICVTHLKRLEVVRLMPHNLSLSDLGPNPLPIINFYESFIQSASTWLRMVQEPVTVVAQRLIETSRMEDRIVWASTGSKENDLEVRKLAARIRSGSGMTPLVPADFAVESDPFEIDPSLTL